MPLKSSLYFLLPLLTYAASIQTSDPGSYAISSTSAAFNTPLTGTISTTAAVSTGSASPSFVNATSSAAVNVSANGVPIVKGYVAFGDSYAAGIGTGTTEGDSCRRGQYSYPEQLASMAVGNIDFQNLPCSGAIVGNVLQGGDNSQIDAWTTPSNADIATLSIGGNDIGFYPILTACVLRVGQAAAGDCDTTISNANSKISGQDLSNDISSALQQIMQKSGRTDLKIFLTGYPEFFNANTESCEYSTFYYWQPGHHGFHRPGNWAYLYKNVRTKLNSLVANLNTMLAQIADSVNEANAPNQRVWFVDPNPRFNDHRFCEVDAGTEVTEPDSTRMDTWLFLSGWPDNSLPGAVSAQNQAITAGNSSALPDPNTCASSLGQSTDWADQMLCDTAIAVAEGVAPFTSSNSTGPNNASEVFSADQQAIADQNYTAVEVPWWLPTKQAKTFHPRTLGQQAYKLAIMEVW